jgi:hypothetical protein
MEPHKALQQPRDLEKPANSLQPEKQQHKSMLRLSYDLRNTVDFYVGNLD